MNLVERNRNPNGAQILSLNTISIHESSDIVALANQISRADEAIKHNATGKLSVILEQIKHLQEQARKILAAQNQNTDFHHAACNFMKVPGKTYHLYKRPSGQTYFSMLSPDAWGGSCTHEFIGSYRLEPDQSWTPVDRIAEVNEVQEWAEHLLNANAAKPNGNLLAIDNIMDMDV